MRWSSRATVSREHGDAPVVMAATVKQNAALPWVERWCWWLEEVEVMVEQLWLRRIDQWSYIGGDWLRRSCGGDAASSELCFGKAEREGGSESGRVE